MRDFRWSCGTSVLVDDAYEQWEVVAPTVIEAMDAAMEHMAKVNGRQRGNILDEGTLDISMNIEDLAKAIQEIASGDDDMDSSFLAIDLEACKDKEALMSTLEWIVCNANTEGRWE